MLMRRVASACDELEMSYFITGSLAGMTWGEPRHTDDVDVVVQLSPLRMGRFCAAFPAPDWYASEESAMLAARTGGMFNIIYVPDAVKADVIAFRNTDFERSCLARRRRVVLPDGAAVMVSAPEDVIVNKLLFSMP